MFGWRSCEGKVKFDFVLFLGEFVEIEIDTYDLLLMW